MWLLIFKAILTVLPFIVEAVRDGRIKEGAKDEVLRELASLQKARVDAAAAARDAVKHGLPLNEQDKYLRR